MFNGPHGACNDMRIRMRFRLLLRQPAAQNQLIYKAVIHGQQHQFPIAQAIQTAVAAVGGCNPFVRHDHDGKRCSHRFSAVGVIDPEYGVVDFQNGMRQKFHSIL